MSRRSLVRFTGDERRVTHEEWEVNYDERKVKHEDRGYWRQWAHWLKAHTEAQRARSPGRGSVTQIGRKHPDRRGTCRSPSGRVGSRRRVEFAVVRERGGDGVLQDINQQPPHL